MDVSSLYTNIPHKDGIQACFEAFQTRTVKSPPSKELCHLLELTLNSNNFIFNDDNYIQVSGTLMGGKYAPSYANIFMDKFEHDLLSACAHKPLVWYRFIDDIFLIWTHSEEDLLRFIELANSMHPTIRFTTHHSTAQVDFLDVQVKLTPNNTIIIDLFTKPTDKHLYLQPASCHPRHITKNIPYSLGLRLRRICSEDDTLNKRTHELKQQLFNRGYKESNISTQINKAKNVKREDALQYNINKSKSNRVPLVVTYHPDLPYLNSIMKKHWPIIQSHPRLQNALPELPIVSHRRPPTYGTFWSMLK